MKRSILLMALVAVIGCSRANHESTVKVESDQTIEAAHINWHTGTFEELLALAAKDPRPIMVDFYADW